MVKKKRIENNEEVTGYKYGSTVELSNAVSGTPVMKKINKDEMVNRYTGEVVNIEHSVSRDDVKNKESLRSTFKNLRRLIGANFEGGNNELWVTLTYRFVDGQPMRDARKLFNDFRLLVRKLRRFLKKELAYIAVIEPQGNGAFHLHVLLKSIDKGLLFIPNKKLSELWEEGFVNVRRLKNSDNVANYLMSYLTDIDLFNLDGNFKNKNSKKIVKGGRLGLYPQHFQIYRTSRNIVKPLKVKGQANSVKQDLGILENDKPDFFKTFEINRGDKNLKITSEFYKLKR